MPTMPEPDPYLLQWVEDLGLDASRIRMGETFPVSLDSTGQRVITVDYYDLKDDGRTKVLDEEAGAYRSRPRMVLWKPFPERPPQPDATTQAVRHALYVAFTERDMDVLSPWREGPDPARSWQPVPLEHSEVDDRALCSRVVRHTCTICGRVRGSWLSDPDAER